MSMAPFLFLLLLLLGANSYRLWKSRDEEMESPQAVVIHPLSSNSLDAKLIDSNNFL